MSKIATLTSSYRGAQGIHPEFYAEITKYFGGVTVLVNGSMKHSIGDGIPMNPVIHDLLSIECSDLDEKSKR